MPFLFANYVEHAIKKRRELSNRVLAHERIAARGRLVTSEYECECEYYADCFSDCFTRSRTRPCQQRLGVLGENTHARSFVHARDAIVVHDRRNRRQWGSRKWMRARVHYGSEQSVSPASNHTLSYELGSERAGERMSRVERTSEASGVE